LDERRELKLALDTTQNSGSIALATGERLVYSAFFDIRITHSETLMPSIDHALKFCGAEPRDLEAIYVCRGPGSFTGLRIGLATAKGIAFGLDIPLYAYSSLELAALGACGLGRNILVAIDAKMKEVYYAAYNQNLEELISPQVAKPEELGKLELDDYILCGSAVQQLEPLLKATGQHYSVLSPAHQFIGAAGLFYLAEKLPDKHAAQDLADLEPLYIRESTAQVKQSQIP
jgi:tRNA threonylcarbamoyladenosine biosynthesis protein TsaB